ncbi:unnamed protein product [Sphagnum tenellum]
MLRRDVLSSVISAALVGELFSQPIIASDQIPNDMERYVVIQTHMHGVLAMAESYKVLPTLDGKKQMLYQIDWLMGYMLQNFSGNVTSDHMRMAFAQNVGELTIDQLRQQADVVVPVSVMRQLVRSDLFVGLRECPNFAHFVSRYYAAMIELNRKCEV